MRRIKKREVKKRRRARRARGAAYKVRIDGRSVDGAVWAETDRLPTKRRGSTIIHGDVPLEIAYITTDGPKPYLSAIFEDGKQTVITKAKLKDIAANLMLYSVLVQNLAQSLSGEPPTVDISP